MTYNDDGELIYFTIYDYDEGHFLPIYCCNRNEANKWCDKLERATGRFFAPVKFKGNEMIGRL